MTSTLSKRADPAAGLRGLLEARLAEGGPDALVALRRAAMERFEALGWPTRKSERWKYTNLQPVARGRFVDPAAVPAEETVAERLPDGILFSPEHDRLVFVDGRFAPALSRLPRGEDGPEALPLRAALEDGSAPTEALGSAPDDEPDAVAALNLALFADGALVRVPAGRRCERPLELVFVRAARGAGTFPRVHVELEEGSRARLVERHVDLGSGTSLALPCTRVSIGDAAALEHALCVEGGPGSFHVALARAVLGRDARLAAHVFLFGGALVRHELDVRFRERGGELELRGLFAADQDEHADLRTFVDHAPPLCRSDQVVRGVVGGRAHGAFNGEVLVRQDAQRTDAHQSNKNLLLSDAARVDTKPQLEIFADDVKCSHGATIGQLDREALFYLRSRGIGEAEARSLLTRAFAAEVIGTVGVRELAETLDTLLRKRLA